MNSVSVYVRSQIYYKPDELYVMNSRIHMQTNCLHICELNFRIRT